MNARVDQLFDEARGLGAEERSQLALALLDSVEGEMVDESAVEQAWIAEAHRRLEMIAECKVKMVPWKDAKARIAAL
ncbi:MAG: addiction module protein [Aquabacterium sp.]|nr:addiction module protein [Aquabacterium sp.]